MNIYTTTIGKSRSLVRNSSKFLAVIGAGMGFLMAQQAQRCEAALMVNISEIGGDLVFDVDGTLTLAGVWVGIGVGLLPDGSPSIYSDAGDGLSFGSTPALLNGTQIWEGLNGITSITGDQPSNSFVDTTGNTVPDGQALGYDTGALGLVDTLFLPNSFNNGDSVDFTFVFGGADLTTLGSNLGDSWTVNLSGGDSITYNVVPEPSSLILGGVMLLLANGRSRRRKFSPPAVS